MSVDAVDAEGPEQRRLEERLKGLDDVTDWLAMTDCKAITAADESNEERLAIQFTHVSGHGNSFVDTRNSLNADYVNVRVVQKCVNARAVEVHVSLLDLFGALERVNPWVVTGIGRSVPLALAVRTDGTNDEAWLRVALINSVLADFDSIVDRLVEALYVIPVAIGVRSIGAGDSTLRTSLKVVDVRVFNDFRRLIKDLRRPLGVVQVATILLLHLGGESTVKNEGLVHGQESPFFLRDQVHDDVINNSSDI